MCYGSPVGTKEYVQHQLFNKVKEIASEIEQIVKVMDGEGQAMWTIARSSSAMKLDYHLSLCYPSDVEIAAKEMDSQLWKLL